MLFNQWGTARQVILNPPPAPRVWSQSWPWYLCAEAHAVSYSFRLSTAFFLSVSFPLLRTWFTLYFSSLYSFPVAAINKLPQSGWLKTQECIFPQLWRPEAQNQSVRRATLHPEFLGEVVPCPSQVVVAPGISWLVASSLQSLVPSSLALCVSSCSFFLL